MANIYYNSKKIVYSLIFLMIPYFSNTMENVNLLPRVLDQSKPSQILNLYDFKEKLASRKTKPTDLFPTSLLITPPNPYRLGDVEVLIGRQGAVYSFSIDKQPADPPKYLVKLPNVKHVPMLAAAIKGDIIANDLLIAIAGNYTNTLEKRVAEILLYYRKSNVYAQKHLDKPIQSIAIDNKANWLVIAQNNGIQVLDLRDIERPLYALYMTKYHDRISCADVMPSGNNFVFAGANEGNIRVHELKEGLPSLASFDSKDRIKKIRYIDNATILYSTNEGIVKQINCLGALQKEIHQQRLSIAEADFLEEIVFDSSDQNIIAYWTVKDDKNRGAQRFIKIYRKNKDGDDEFILLEAEGLEREYDFESEKGSLEVGFGYLIDVAVRDNCAIAIGTDGKLYVWKIPQETINTRRMPRLEFGNVVRGLEEKGYLQFKSSGDKSRNSTSDKSRNSTSDRPTMSKSKKGGLSPRKLFDGISRSVYGPSDRSSEGGEEKVDEQKKESILVKDKDKQFLPLPTEQKKVSGDSSPKTSSPREGFNMSSIDIPDSLDVQDLISGLRQNEDKK